jgi:hypothetical protein
VDITEGIEVDLMESDNTEPLHPVACVVHTYKLAAVVEVIEILKYEYIVWVDYCYNKVENIACMPKVGITNLPSINISSIRDRIL